LGKPQTISHGMAEQQGVLGPVDGSSCGGR